MADISIEQAIFQRVGEADPVLRARSPGFLPAWHEPIAATLRAFGVRPVGVACPSAVFAQPLDREHVLVVHVADLDQSDTATRPLGFRVLVVPHRAYTFLWSDPFALAERQPPDWSARGELPILAWPDTPLPVRTVEQVRRVLQRVKGQPLSEDLPGEQQMQSVDPEQSESPTLLGGTQVLVDGGKLVFHRPQPDTDLLRALWTLLPNSTRGEIWPASFAFSNALQFDVVVVPRFRAEDFPDYTTEELAGEYPESRYEYHLQVAAESGNQHELNLLFERRSLRQTLRLGVLLAIALSVIAILLRCR